MTDSTIFHSTEFYYAESPNLTGSEFILGREESTHAIKVMRHSVDDLLNVTDGKGNVYKCKILKASEKETLLRILSKTFIADKYANFKFFIPILKSVERLEFAIEKAVELGITKFVIYSGIRSHKRSIKLDRWEKIAISAMKQSLRSYKPEIEYHNSLNEIARKDEMCIIFDQLARESFAYSEKLDDRKTNLIFGPEAGLSENEIELFSNKRVFSLGDSRLRTETAVITAASVLTRS